MTDSKDNSSEIEIEEVDIADKLYHPDWTEKHFWSENPDWDYDILFNTKEQARHNRGFEIVFSLQCYHLKRFLIMDKTFIIPKTGWHVDSVLWGHCDPKLSLFATPFK